jgi:1-acyl-sn-glycerol-3-phosphate acyltransferase
VIEAGGAFKVRRGEQDDEAIATAVSLARDGHAVVMFPEGTRRQKGLRKKHEARWRSGAARIALEAGVPLVPAGIAGTDRLARLGPLRVAYGPPIEVDDLEELPGDEAARVATERLAAAVHELERQVA